MLLDLTLVSWLAVADAAALAAAGGGYLAVRRLHPVSAEDLPSAFAVLERSIGKYAPGAPRGYTWEEAFEWLEEEGVKADWGEMKKKLGEYEAFRYGGAPLVEGGEKEVVALALELRRDIVGK